jgi:cell division protease FtsH
VNYLILGITRGSMYALIALGYTLNLPEEDRYLKTREELIDMMTMLLGGRAAEELIIGSITNGAADDLSRVTQIAHSMVHEWAMGTGITSMRVSDGETSESLRRVIDDEVRELADEAMRCAVELLAAHRPQLDQLAGRLLTEESLEREDIDRVMAGVPRARPARRPETHLGLAAADPGDGPGPAR